MANELRSLRHRVGDPDAKLSREAISAGLITDPLPSPTKIRELPAREAETDARFPPGRSVGPRGRPPVFRAARRPRGEALRTGVISIETWRASGGAQ